MKSPATTVEQYLKSLPADRRAAIAAVRDTVRKHLPRGYEESIGYGMITWCVPFSVYRATYSGMPLLYAALASQKNYMALYLMCAYGSPALVKQLEDGFTAAGKKLDMGKSCIRFRSLSDLPLETIGKVVAAVPIEQYVAIAQSAHSPEARAQRSSARHAAEVKSARVVASGGRPTPVESRRPSAARTRTPHRAASKAAVSNGAATSRATATKSATRRAAVRTVERRSTAKQK